tara:strand:- start:861 stop:1238 length:378 start_codon:yes stop_codon:yes gene_type:complete
MDGILSKLKKFLTNYPDDRSYLEAKLEMLDTKIMHIEDSLLDYRDILLKLVKQGNSLVKFLSQIDEPYGPNTETKVELVTAEGDKKQFYLDLAKEFEQKIKKLSELEKELEKYKDQITPGQVGDA